MHEQKAISFMAIQLSELPSARVKTASRRKRLRIASTERLLGHLVHSRHVRMEVEYNRHGCHTKDRFR